MIERHGALENITILDLGRVVAVPFCTSVLADMGAKVIKVERPGSGDDSRSYGPYVNGESAYFANLNRNKYGITVDMKTEEGKEIIKELVKKVDVVVENYRPGVMDKLGLGYEVLKEINPQIIYLEISGFGSYGRYSQRPGYDVLAQAMSGMMSLTGPRGGEPTRTGSAIGDMVAGLHGVIGILAAINARSLTGKGQKVDVALLDSMIVMTENCMTRYRYSGQVYKRNGNAYAAIAPYDSFRAKDGSFVMSCGNQALFDKFAAKVTKHEEWLTDPRFENNVIRTENADSLKELIEEWASAYSVKEVVDLCLSNGVPAAEIYDLSQVVKDPHIVEDREMFPVMHHPVIGDQYVNGWAIKLQDTKQSIYKSAPTLGEDTDSILKEVLGYDDAKLGELRDKDAI